MSESILPDPNERSRMTSDGLHIVWCDDFKPGQVKAWSRDLVECGRGTTRAQIDAARSTGLMARLLKLFGWNQP